MSKVQYFPRYRITLNELKYEQNLRYANIDRIYEVLSPRAGKDGRQGIIGSDPGSGTYGTASGMVTFSVGLRGAVTINLSGEFFKGIQTPDGVASISELGNPVYETFTSISVATDWFTEAINAPATPSANSTWVNFYMVPGWRQIEDQIYNGKYIDSVTTDMSILNVIDKTGRITAPYPQTSPTIRGSDIGQQIKIYQFSGRPIGGIEIPSAHQVVYEFDDVCGTTAVSVPLSSVAVYLGAVYYDASKPAGGVRYTSANYGGLPYKAFIGAEMISYDTTAAGETGTYQTYAQNLQKAIGIPQETISGAETKYTAMSASISAMDGVVFITKNAGLMTSAGYTSSTSFPSGVGTRWDK